MPKSFAGFGFKKVTAVEVTGDQIAASTWRWDGNSGSVLVSSGFPLKPGQVTSSTLSQVRVYVNSVEQAVALKALDGRFPDDSFRSIGIQFTYNLTNNTPVSSEVHVNTGTARGTSDGTWVDPTRTMVLKKAVIAPTNPAHLCATAVTLTPLTPATNDTGINATWIAYAATAWADSGISTGSNEGGGTANYDHWTGLMNLYCRTGTRSWYQSAYDWATGFAGDTGIHSSAQQQTLMEYLLPSSNTSPANETIWNPENLSQAASSGNVGYVTEAYGYGRNISLCTMYWVTAYRQFKRFVARDVNNALYGYATNYGTWRDRTSTWYGHRYNLRNFWAPVISGYLLGCTTGFDTPEQYPAVTSWDYVTYLDGLLDTLEYYAWNKTSDYRNGLVGQRDTTIDITDQPGHAGTGTQWGITNFQLALVAEQLILFYDYVYPDSRIPPWIKLICDYIITQTKPAETGDSRADQGIDWVSTYINLTPTAAATPTFTAITVSGNSTITYTGGNIPNDFFLPGHSFSGTGIQANTLVGTAYVNSTTSGTAIPLTAGDGVTARPATASGTPTLRVFYNPYDLPMYALMFAWYYAYSGTSIYDTWAGRFLDDIATVAAMDHIKNWAEVYGGTRQGVLYYRAGGTIRGTAGVHPTVATNPALQSTSDLSGAGP